MLRMGESLMHNKHQGHPLELPWKQPRTLTGVYWPVTVGRPVDDFVRHEVMECKTIRCH